jgi:hypothetical protein
MHDNGLKIMAGNYTQTKLVPMILYVSLGTYPIRRVPANGRVYLPPCSSGQTLGCSLDLLVLGSTPAFSATIYRQLLHPLGSWLTSGPSAI